MYFDIEDHRPEFTPVGRAISWREGVLLSIIVHLVGVIVLMRVPLWIPATARTRALATPPSSSSREESPRFVYVAPRVDVPTDAPRERAAPSDLDRRAQTIERAAAPVNTEPLSRGNTPERVEAVEADAARGGEPVSESVQAQAESKGGAPDLQARQPDSVSAMQFPSNRSLSPGSRLAGRAPLSGGPLGDSLRNLQRYVERNQYDNPQGGGNFGPAIQFDTKGVEFGPWIRRFIAQVKRNWEPLIPLAAMSMKGRVVITFNVHRDGTLTDLTIIGPCPIPAFNTAAYGALASSNPTVALPPEYPSDHAFFTVTFFYNEEPQ